MVEEIERDDRFDDDKCLKTLSWRKTRSVISSKKVYKDFFKGYESIPFPVEPDFQTFAKSWTEQINASDNYFIKFIYLWFIFNSWLSLVVAHLDSSEDYLKDNVLISVIAAAEIYADRFEALRKEEEFNIMTQEFIKLGPIFKATWLNREYITPPWRKSRLSRTAWVKKVHKDNKVAIKKTRKASQYPFNPECAFEHDYGKIPCDWHHTIWMIYQVRCNLFHGGKGYNLYDREFIEKSYKILWGMLKKEKFVKDILD